jgi:Zn-finger nucleic acid-binding protein
MERVLYRQTMVDRCCGCGGIWFDISEQEDLKKDPGSEKIDTGDRKTGKKMDSMRDIDCPACGNRMVSLVALKRREIHYEKCSICYGVFLDAGEFEDYKQEMSFADILASALFGHRPD